MLGRLLLVGLMLAVACAPTRSAPDFTTCRGFLELDEVAPVSQAPGLRVERRSVTQTARAQVPAIEGYCQITFLTPDRLRSIALEVIRYTSAEAAQEEYLRLRDSLGRLPGVLGTEGFLGEASYQVEVNSRGMGSLVTFRRGAYRAQLHTTMPAGEAPLAPVEGLRQLASKVWERLF